MFSNVCLKVIFWHLAVIQLLILDESDVKLKTTFRLQNVEPHKKLWKGIQMSKCN